MPGEMVRQLFASSHCSRAAARESCGVVSTSMSARPRARAMTWCMSSAGWETIAGCWGSTPGVITSEGRMPSPAYLVKVPWLIMVITVSRCICERTLGMSRATIRFTLPEANSLLARISTPWVVERSPRPISTAPLPITSTSPPSTAPVPFMEPKLNTGNSSLANSGCQR